MQLGTALPAAVLMRARLTLHLSWKISGALEDALKGLSQSNLITTALSQASFHFSYLSDHTVRGNCMGKGNRLVGKLPPTLAEPGFLHPTFTASCPSSREGEAGASPSLVPWKWMLTTLTYL